jgi:isoleucyl-tRNA synthetase
VGAAGGDDSVFLHTWHELPAQAGEADLLDRWARIRAVRADVQKELETVRVAGGIGSSLQAEVILHASPSTRPCWRRWATTCASC